MHHLLTIIKTEGANATRILSERYAPSYKFTCANNRYLVLNSKLFAKQLQNNDYDCINVLRAGAEAYDTRTCKAVDVSGADPAYCII